MEAQTDSQNLSDVYICILAGGSGTRLWPISRNQTPKQLLTLAGDRSMLQQTLDRILPLVPQERILILTDPDHVEPIANHLPGFPRENIMAEPSARGTAPALGLAAFRLRHKLPGSTVMVSLHADHTIALPERFRDAVRTAIATARNGYLVTIGVVPHYPETGYGYIERGREMPSTSSLPIHRIARFHEKPRLELAQEYLSSGHYDWNTGYFAWTLDTILRAFQLLQPTIYSQLSAITEAIGTPDADTVMDSIWSHIERTTIDVGIMEKATNAAVVSCDLGWNDVGSWASLYDILPHDENDNVVRGDGEHLEIDTQDCLISTDGRLIVSLGLKDLVVVDTGDVVLVMPRDRAQEVSALVRQLKQHKLDKYL